MITCGRCGKHYKRKLTPYGAYLQCRAYLIYGKDTCSAKRVPEDKLYALIAEVLGIPQFDEATFKACIGRRVLLYGAKRLDI